MKRIFALISSLFLVITLMGIAPVFGANNPYVVDEAGLLSSSEKSDLEEKLQTISSNRQCDVVVLTVQSLGYKTATEYADDYYDENGYGYGSSKDGILFLIAMESRDWAISTTGYGITAFTDYGQEQMMNKITPKLSDGDYYGAFTTYANMCDEYIKEAREDQPYDTNHKVKKSFNFFLIIGDVIAGFGGVFGVAASKKSKLKTIKEAQNARNYVVAGGARHQGTSRVAMAVTQDHFIRTAVTRVPIVHEDRSGGGGGGSSTHIGSSGTTHGGSSGKF